MGVSDGQLSWVLQCAVKDGQLDEFKELMEEMVAGTSDEAGAISYEWFISDDGSTVHLYEKYADSDAAIAHLNDFRANWAGRFMGCVDVKGFTVYGSPSEAAREVMAPLRANLLAPWGGFAR
jgi:quinol monooxygenase YgiN